MTPLDAARVNMTIFHNHSVHWYYITRMEGTDYIKYDIIIFICVPGVQVASPTYVYERFQGNSA